MLMERNVLSEQNEQGLEKKAVQTDGKGSGKSQKKRSQADKIGRHKWNQQLLNRVLERQDAIFEQLRWVRVKLDRLGEADYRKLI
jgi:hypothetical protein